jgi:ABC-2 type transport system ATP-binding protein
MSKPVISVKNLVKKYKKADTNAVDNISFDVEEGEFFTFLGPNGAGKTTTISILTTTLSSTSGEVIIGGLDLKNESSKIRNMIGIIFQNPSLDLNLTAEENIRFHATLFGIYSFSPSYKLMPKEYKDRISELAEIVGIQKEIHKPVKTFSGGMKRKLEIVRSLMHNPKILFLDEPTTGLDPESRKNVWAYLEEVRKTNKTTIFLTTHYLEEAENSDKVCIINKGNIVANGTPRELKKELLRKTITMSSGNISILKKELDKLGYEYEGEEEVKVLLNGKHPQEIIKSIDTKLDRLEITMPTLEETYLEIITEEGEDY